MQSSAMIRLNHHASILLILKRVFKLKVIISLFPLMKSFETGVPNSLMKLGFAYMAMSPNLRGVSREIVLDEQQRSIIHCSTSTSSNTMYRGINEGVNC